MAAYKVSVPAVETHHSRKGRFSWVRKLVSTSRSSNHKTQAAVGSHRTYSEATISSTLQRSRARKMSPVTTTTSSLAPLYRETSSHAHSTVSRDDYSISARTASVTTSASGGHHSRSYSRRWQDDASSFDSATSNGSAYGYNNVFASPAASMTATPSRSARHRKSKLTPSSTTGTPVSVRSPSILSSSSSTNNTSVLTNPSAWLPSLASAAGSINTSYQFHMDNASILTLASSSKRRRKSIDTNASTRALAPESLFGGSRESLPLTVATGRSGLARSISVPASSRMRRSLSKSRWTNHTHETASLSGRSTTSDDESERETSDYYDEDDTDGVDRVDRGRSTSEYSYD
ncbi:hypothetical protein V1512DRAFT_259028 [Lipomyces arxii]|uniref:uncharacterized protein n=1 Tax=Lipomyces arxii TaxID=56418 RepID=UPI0034CE0FC5